MSFTSTTLQIFSCSTIIFVVSLFSNVFSLGANKEDLLHVTHHIISSLLFGWNSPFSRLFQHVMSLTYEHEMSFLCLGMNIFFLLRCDNTHLHTKWCSPHHVCIMWKETIERINGPKRKDVLFSYVFKNPGYKIILICVLIIWLNTSHHNNIVHVLWY